jgi:outer membrane protein, heavy metal efflux system
MIAAFVAWLGVDFAHAQGPTIHSGAAQDPGSVRSSLGPIPGAGGNPFGGTPGTDATFLGGRPGPSMPRVPSEITMPGGRAAPPSLMIGAPSRLKITDVPLFGPLEVPAAAEEEGPPDGLTLDAAIERLVVENLALRAIGWQIPAARADVITAGLRANPLLYADTQLVPYGQYNKSRSGGPTQYDVNVTHPVDYSGKRRARIAAAELVVKVQEVQYQDAVRVQIENLYTVYVDVLAARETIRYARASQAGLQRLLEINETLYQKADATRADVGKVETMLHAADLAVLDSEAMQRRTRRSLGLLLNLPLGQADALQVRGRLADLAPPPPGSDELMRIALESRPDLLALRLGVRRAEAGVRVAHASRFGDAYVLYQPYTLQNNAPIGLKSPTSWALGLTIPIPIFNLNQGGVARSRLNVNQTLTEVAAMERKLAAEVRDAERQYHVTRELVRKIEADLLPPARRLRDDTLELFVKGELTAVEADNARQEYNQVVRRYRDTLIRHRRSMLTLNTVVGRRVLP